jgi:hypothetical protein
LLNRQINWMSKGPLQFVPEIEKGESRRCVAPYQVLLANHHTTSMRVWHEVVNAILPNQIGRIKARKHHHEDGHAQQISWLAAFTTYGTRLSPGC